MAQFVYLRNQYPPNAETVVFEALKALPDSWLVVWGYYFRARQSERTKEREGDFIISSAEGGILILEVKGWDSLTVNEDGTWGPFGADNPFDQVDAQYGAVGQVLGAVTERYVHLTRALCLPNCTDEQIAAASVAFQRTILGLTDLRNLAERWAPLGYLPAKFSDDQTVLRNSPFVRGRMLLSGAEHAAILEAQLARHIAGPFVALRYLPDTRRFKLRGSVGSGKTWTCLEIAGRWVNEGQRVLFVCYNEALSGEWAKMRAAPGTPFTVIPAENRARLFFKNLAGLAHEVLHDAGIITAPPEAPGETRAYYEQTLPALVAEALAAGRIAPRYDALIVDEGQDISTTGVPHLARGWWSLLFSLLLNPDTATMAVAYDAVQRPGYWQGQFVAAELETWLGPSAVTFRHPHCLRYTREIASYLRQVAQERFPGLNPGIYDGATHGPEPERVVTDDIRGAVETILRRWTQEQRIPPAEIAIIGNSRNPEKYGLKLKARLAGFELVPLKAQNAGCLGYLSAGASKGIERKAVIVIGFDSPETLEPIHLQEFLIAASRAKIRLAVVSESQ